MANGKVRAYYWHIFTRLAELADFLDLAPPGHSFPPEDEVIWANATILSHASGQSMSA